MTTEPRNVMEAIQDYAIKGQDPLGARRQVAVDLAGHVITKTAGPLPVGGLYTLTVSSTVVRIPGGSIPLEADYAEGYVRTATVVFTCDGQTDPTATKGMPAEAGDVIILRCRDEILNFQAIREGGTAATIDFEFYMEGRG